MFLGVTLIISTVAAAAASGYYAGLTTRTAPMPDLDKINEQQNKLVELSQQLYRNQQLRQIEMVRLAGDLMGQQSNIAVATINASANIAGVSVDAYRATTERQIFVEAERDIAHRTAPANLDYQAFINKSEDAHKAEGRFIDTFVGTGQGAGPQAGWIRDLGETRELEAFRRASGALTSDPETGSSNFQYLQVDQATGKPVEDDNGYAIVLRSEEEGTHAAGAGVLANWVNSLAADMAPAAQSEFTKGWRTETGEPVSERDTLVAHYALTNHAVRLIEDAVREYEQHPEVRLPPGTLVNDQLRWLIEDKVHQNFNSKFGVTQAQVTAFRDSFDAGAANEFQYYTEKAQRMEDYDVGAPGGGAARETINHLARIASLDPVELVEELRKFEIALENSPAAADATAEYEEAQRQLQVRFDQYESQKLSQDTVDVWARTAQAQSWMVDSSGQRVNAYNDIKQALDFTTDLEMALWFHARKEHSAYPKALEAFSLSLELAPAGSPELQSHLLSELVIEEDLQGPSGGMSWRRAAREARRYPEQGGPAVRLLDETDEEAMEEIFPDRRGDGPRELQNIMPPIGGPVAPTTGQPVDDQRAAWGGEADTTGFREPSPDSWDDLPEADVPPAKLTRDEDGSDKKSDGKAEESILNKAIENLRVLRDKQMTKKESGSRHRAYRGEIAKRAASKLVPNADGS